MPEEDQSDQIECPYCGKSSPVYLTSCPECGQSFYPEDELGAVPNRPVRKRGEGLVLRVVTFVLIGALLGSGFGLIIGPGWVWFTLLGGIIFGLLGLAGDWMY